MLNLPTHLSKCCLKPFEQVKFFLCGENGELSVALFREYIQTKPRNKAMEKKLC